VASYVYRETAALSVIGTLVGLVLGIALHRFVVLTAEMDTIMFGREIYPVSFILSALITLVFSALVCLAMAKKLKDIDMVESMKANE
jgi:putative ABC transport system permease protein